MLSSVPSPRVRTALAVASLLAIAAVSTAAAPGTLTVRRGDTLSELARRYGTTVAALQAANGLTGSRIYADSTLALPGGATAATRTHVVSSGETVTTIARRYGTSVGAVLSANGLAAGSLLRPGQSLAVPGAGAPAAPAAPARSGTAESSAAAHRATLATRSFPSRDAVRALVARTARSYGVDVSLALAVAYQESGFQQRVVSEVDAIGVMQVLPSTGRGVAATLGRPLDLLDVQDNVTAGVALLKQLRATTGSDAGALAAYYQGFGSIRAQGLLPQTQAYIKSVQALRARFANG